MLRQKITQRAPASMGSASRAFENSRNAMAAARSFAQQYIAQCDAGSVSLEGLFADVLANFASYHSVAQDAAATPGIDNMARLDYGNDTLNYVAWLNGNVMALADCLGWLETNWPQSQEKDLDLVRFAGDGLGGTTGRTVTDATWRTNLKAQLTAVYDAAALPA